MEVPEDASKINIETNISQTMGNILSTSQDNSQDDKKTVDTPDDSLKDNIEVMEPLNVFNQQTTQESKLKEDDVDEYTKNLSAQDINLIIMGKSTTDDSQSSIADETHSNVTDDLWLQSSQELKNVRVDTDEDFEVIVKSLETAIDATDSYETIASTSKSKTNKKITDETDDIVKCLDVDNLHSKSNPIQKNISKVVNISKQNSSDLIVLKSTSSIDNVEQPSSSNDNIKSHHIIEHSEDTNESEDFTLRLEEEDDNCVEMKKISSSISEEVVTSSTPDLPENVSCSSNKKNEEIKEETVESCNVSHVDKNSGDKTEDINNETECVNDRTDNVRGEAENVKSETINLRETKIHSGEAKNFNSEIDVKSGEENIKKDKENVKTEVVDIKTESEKIKYETQDITNKVESLKSEIKSQVMEVDKKTAETENIEVQNSSLVEKNIEVDKKSLTKTESETKSESITETKNESITKTKNESIREMKSESITEFKNGSVTGVKSESTTEMKNELITEVKSESITETKSELISETKNQSFTGIASKSITGTKNELIPESENESIIETENESFIDTVCELISEAEIKNIIGIEDRTTAVKNKSIVEVQKPLPIRIETAMETENVLIKEKKSSAIETDKIPTINTQKVPTVESESITETVRAITETENELIIESESVTKTENLSSIESDKTSGVYTNILSVITTKSESIIGTKSENVSISEIVAVTETKTVSATETECKSIIDCENASITETKSASTTESENESNHNKSTNDKTEHTLNIETQHAIIEVQKSATENQKKSNENVDEVSKQDETEPESVKEGNNVKVFDTEIRHKIDDVKEDDQCLISSSKQEGNIYEEDSEEFMTKDSKEFAIKGEERDNKELIEKQNEDVQSNLSEIELATKLESQENSSPQKIKLIRYKPKLKGKKGGVKNSDILLEKSELSTEKEISVKKSDIASQNLETISQNLENPSQNLETPSQKLEILSQKLESPLQKLEIASQKLETSPPKSEIYSEKFETTQKLETSLWNVETPSQNIETSLQKPDISSQKSEEQKEIEIPKKEESTEVVETKTPQKLKLTRNYRVPKSVKKVVKQASQEKPTEENKKEDKTEKKKDIEKMEIDDTKIEKEIKIEERKVIEIEVEQMVKEMEADVKGIKENFKETKYFSGINENVQVLKGSSCFTEMKYGDIMTSLKELVPGNDKIINTEEKPQTESTTPMIKTHQTKSVTVSETDEKSTTVSDTDKKSVNVIETDKKSMNVSGTARSTIKSEIVKKSVMETEADKKSKIESETHKNSMIESETDKKSVIESETNKEPVIESQKDQKSVIKHETDKKLLIETEINKESIFNRIKSSIVTETDSNFPTKTETDNKSIVTSESDKKSFTVSKTDKKSVNVSETDMKSVNVSETDTKSVNISETDKKSVDVSEIDKKSVNVIEIDKKSMITSESNKSMVISETDMESMIASETNTKLVTVSEIDKQSVNISEKDNKSVNVSATDKKSVIVGQSNKKSIVVSETDTELVTVSETDTKSAIATEIDTKSVIASEIDTKSEIASKTDTKSVSVNKIDNKLIMVSGTDKKSVTVSEVEKKSVPATSASIPEVELLPKEKINESLIISEKCKPTEKLGETKIVEKIQIKVKLDEPSKEMNKSKIFPQPLPESSEDLEENIEDMLPKTIISRTISEPEPPVPQPIEEIPVKVPKKRGRKKKVILPPSEVPEVDTTPTVMVTRRGSTRLSTRLEEIQKPSVSIQHIPAKRPAEIEISKITKKLKPNEPETIVIEEDEDILNKVDDIIDNRDSPKFDQSTNESFLKIVSVCSIVEEPKRIEPITKPLRVEVDLDEPVEDIRNIPKITITKQRASPKIRIKPILKPDEIQKNSPTDNTPRVIIKPIKQDPLKITITKQSDDSHSILKIYKPEDNEETVPKLTIKPIPKPDDMQHSPRHSKMIKQTEIGPNITVKPVMSCEVVSTDTHSPKSRKAEENYPKVTIKPILRPEDIQKSQPLSPRQTLKMKAFESSGITMEPILTSPNSESQVNPLKIKTLTKPEETLSPKLTIKPIVKTCEIVQSEDGTSNPLKLTIKPLKEDSHQSPKITIKPVLKPEELTQEEDKPERIILKIQKTNLPSPKERTSVHVKENKEVRTEPIDTNEKLGKIKLKLMKEAGHAQIIPSQIMEENHMKRTLLSVGESPSPEKRPRHELGPEILHTSDISINIVEPNHQSYPKTVSDEVTIMKIDQPLEKSSRSNILSRALTNPQQSSESKFKEMLLQIQQKSELTCTPQIIQDQSSDSDDVRIIGIIPGDKLNEPINKEPISVNEESSSQDVIIVSETINSNPFHDLQFIKTTNNEIPVATNTNTSTITPDLTVTPIIPEVVIPTPKKRGRPRKNPLEVKPEIKGEDCIEIETRPKRTCRAPVGRVPYVVTERKPRGRGGGRGRGRGGTRGGLSPKPGKETKSPRGRKSLKAQFSRLYAEPDEKDVLNQLNQSTGDVTNSNTENIDKNLMKEPKLTGQISKLPTPIKDKKEIDPVPVFEEETRMSADNNNSRAQTPARQFVVPLPSEGLEESQSSVQSSTTTESGKNKKGRLEVIDYDVHVTGVDQIAEYSWGAGGPYMLQEQIAQYLGVKSFKRKYPGLSRRPVEMQERDFIREKNLVSESLCDMGLTAVPSSEILDIMYTDFQDKYEEYRKYMRDKQSKEISNKQKAISLATSQEKNKIDFKERAIKSAANWNSSFNKARKETRRCCVDLQTFTINYPTGQTHPKVPYKEPVGSYPIALVPGQFTDYFKPYNAAELNYLPLNTVRFGPLLPNQMCIDSGMSDGSVSDSDSSSGSDSDSSDDSMSTIDDAPLSKANTPIPTSAPGTPKSMARAN